MDSTKSSLMISLTSKKKTKKEVQAKISIKIECKDKHLKRISINFLHDPRFAAKFASKNTRKYKI